MLIPILQGETARTQSQLAIESPKALLPRHPLSTVTSAMAQHTSPALF